jgi:hypothetical protein
VVVTRLRQEALQRLDRVDDTLLEQITTDGSRESATRAAREARIAYANRLAPRGSTECSKVPR